MVSRRYQASLSVLARTYWITDRPNLAVQIIWVAVLVAGVFLAAQTVAYIVQNGLIAERPPLSGSQTALRIVLGALAAAFLLMRRDALERIAVASAIVAAGSAALFGLGMRSPLLAAIRLLSHLAMFGLAVIVAWRVLVSMRREAATLH